MHFDDIKAEHDYTLAQRAIDEHLLAEEIELV
jgi:hypothetical protein